MQNNLSAKKTAHNINRLISIAPMMAYTDRHFRRFIRLLTRHTLLYTEMLCTDQLLHGNHDRYLKFSPEEHPLALQLGGCHPKKLAACAKLGAEYGYDEINLNVGCPSETVQAGRFGACLMKEPSLVAECVAAMKAAVDLPITVKTRIGVDDYDSYAHLAQFISQVSQGGCQTFILHARKAWLKGLSPKENRTVPPLKYDIVYQLKKDFPHLEIIINGGIKTQADIVEQLKRVDGVMIGREAYTHPYFFADVDQLFFNGDGAIKTRTEIHDLYFSYLKTELLNGVPKSILTKPLQGLYHRQPGAKQYRIQLSNLN